MVALVLLLAACADGDGSSEYALEPGTYDMAPAQCASTNEAPPYPTPEHQATLLAFDGLTRHQLVIDRGIVDEIVTDADCTLTITRSPFKNSDGIFSARSDRRHVFMPVDCTFSVTFQGQPVVVGAAIGSLFGDRTDKTEEIPYDVTRDGSDVILTSRDLSNLNDLWQNYGCARPDRLKWRLAPVPK